VGDTADDLELVLRYRQDFAHTSTQDIPRVLAAQIAHGDDAQIYQERGADIVVEHIRDLPLALERVLAATRAASGPR
jgi:phosphoglycolate phosphatase-like HAD superfamily hydrolase